jgi:hypothetical protein
MDVLTPTQFSYLGNICVREVNLRGNHISIIETGSFSAMKYIDCTNVPDSMLFKLQLRYMVLIGKYLKLIKVSFFNSIISHGNSCNCERLISDLNPSPNVVRNYSFDWLTNLRTLKIWYSHIAYIEVEAFSGLVRLKTLDLKFNSLTSDSLPKRIFRRIITWKQL